MAQVRINHRVAQEVSLGAAYKIVRTATRHVLNEAKVITLIGPYNTGFLSASLRTQVSVHRGGKEVRGRVGSPLWYALSVHNGARRHVIKPMLPGYPLKFYWRRAGRTVRFMSVNHPGQRGQFFLSEPLAREAARQNLKVTFF